MQNSAGTPLWLCLPLRVGLALFLLVSLHTLQAQNNPADSNELIDLSSPARTLDYVDEACRQGQYSQLRRVWQWKRELPIKPARLLGRQFCYVMQRGFVAAAAVAEPSAGPAEPVLAGHIQTDQPGQSVAVVLVNDQKSPLPSYVFDHRFVAQIPQLYTRLGGTLIEDIPAWASELRLGGLAIWQWVALLLIAVLAAILSWFAAWPIQAVIHYWTSKTTHTLDEKLLQPLRVPVAASLTLGIIYLILPYLFLPRIYSDFILALIQSAIIITLIWFVMRAVSITTLHFEEAVNAADQAYLDRSAQTRLLILRRVVNITLLVLALGLVLTRFEFLRKIGLSLLASAGIAGVIIGLAAQKTVANLLAGVQLALSQPARIGDQVLIEGEFGTVEEINLTYVVVRIWDLRRLVVPISKLLEQPFQNWSRKQPELLGAVFFYADYSAPVETLRSELLRYLPANSLWDGALGKLTVHDTTVTALKLRCLVSAANAGDLVDLRAQVLEHMTGFLARLENGRWLPKAVVSDSAAGGA
ncbi:MAG: mechanosensitive ion channel [Leptospiraceae bacterium]|nr:mechanosensitive ion channel [Leptospiraceae bacterium]